MTDQIHQGASVAQGRGGKIGHAVGDKTTGRQNLCKCTMMCPRRGMLKVPAAARTIGPPNGPLRLVTEGVQHHVGYGRIFIVKRSIGVGHRA